MTYRRYQNSIYPVYPILFVLRLPAPGKELVDLEGYAGSPGFAAQIMYDVQRVFACLEVQTGLPPGRLRDEDYLIAVAQSATKFSAKVTLPMTANSEWRTGPQLIHSRLNLKLTELQDSLAEGAGDPQEPDGQRSCVAKGRALLSKTEALCELASGKDVNLEKAEGLLTSISEFGKVLKEVEGVCSASAGGTNAQDILEKLNASKERMTSWARSVALPQGNFEKVFIDLKDYADSSFPLPEDNLAGVFAEYACATPTVVERASPTFLMRCYLADLTVSSGKW